MRKFFGAAIAASLVIGLTASAAMAYAPFSLDDTSDSGASAYIAGRDLNVSNPGQGSVDLTNLKQVGPPMKLELTLSNPSSHPVNVTFGELGVNYLVPANTTRVVYLSPLEVGTHREVAYSVEQILEPRNTELSTASIQYILDNSYVKTWKEEPVQYQQPASASNTNTFGATDAVRGYW